MNYEEGMAFVTQINAKLQQTSGNNVIGARARACVCVCGCEKKT